MKRLALDLKIEAVIAGAQPVIFLAFAMEPAEGLAGMGQIARLERAEGLHHLELGEGGELVELAHRLFGKSYLIHGGKSASGTPIPGVTRPAMCLHPNELSVRHENAPISALWALTATQILAMAFFA
jgi:hypothetical protein